MPQEFTISSLRPLTPGGTNVKANAFDPWDILNSKPHSAPPLNCTSTHKTPTNQKTKSANVVSRHQKASREEQVISTTTRPNNQKLTQQRTKSKIWMSTRKEKTKRTEDTTTTGIKINTKSNIVTTNSVYTNQERETQGNGTMCSFARTDKPVTRNQNSEQDETNCSPVTGNNRKLVHKNSINIDTVTEMNEEGKGEYTVPVAVVISRKTRPNNSATSQHKARSADNITRTVAETYKNPNDKGTKTRTDLSNHQNSRQNEQIPPISEANNQKSTDKIVQTAKTMSNNDEGRRGGDITSSRPAHKTNPNDLRIKADKGLRPTDRINDRKIVNKGLETTNNQEEERREEVEIPAALVKNRKLVALKILMHTIVVDKLERIETERSQREEADWEHFQDEMRKDW